MERDMEREMTDEERQKLCAALRRKGLNDRAALCYAAADEIERLTKTNERLSNALWAAGVKWEIVEAMTAGPQSNVSEAEESPDGRNTEPQGVTEVYDKTKGHAVVQSDELKTRFEQWAFTRGHRNFTKSGGGYLVPEVQKDWMAFRASGPAAYIPIGGAGNGA